MNFNTLHEEKRLFVPNLNTTTYDLKIAAPVRYKYKNKPHLREIRIGQFNNNKMLEGVGRKISIWASGIIDITEG